MPTQFHTDFYSGGSPTSPIGGTRGRIAPQYFGTLTQVFGTNAVNEIKVGRTDYERRDQPDVRWKGDDFPYHPSLHGGSIITQFTGLTIGASPLNIFQDNTSVRDDYTTSFNAKGRHDIKMGVEYIKFTNSFIWCLRCDGCINAQGRPGPERSTLQQMFPNIYDASTWNLGAARGDAHRGGCALGPVGRSLARRTPSIGTTSSGICGAPGCRTTGA